MSHCKISLFLLLSIAFLFNIIISDDETVNWVAETNTCEPHICGGANITQIPDFSGHLPRKILLSTIMGTQATKLYDSMSTRTCFSGKRLIFFGDSTMEESLHDIAILISGIGGDRDAVLTYFQDSYTYTPKTINLPSQVEVRLQCVNCWHSHRIMEISVKDDPGFLISHFYTGAKLMSKHGGGVDALIYNIVTRWSSIQSYDVVVLNSAEHDYLLGELYMAQQYVSKVRELFEIINNLTSNITKPIKFIWKGISVDAHPLNLRKQFSVELQHFYENEAMAVIRNISSYVFFANTSHGLSQLPPIPANIPQGPHIGQSAHYQAHPFSLLWTSMSTQVLMNSICS